MQNDYSNEEILDAIEADFDFHQYPTKFSLEQISLGDRWLREAALKLLAEGGFHVSSTESERLDSSKGDVAGMPADHQLDSVSTRLASTGRRLEIWTIDKQPHSIHETSKSKAIPEPVHRI